VIQVAGACTEQAPARDERVKGGLPNEFFFESVGLVNTTEGPRDKFVVNLAVSAKNPESL
jgi:hypothetical protein